MEDKIKICALTTIHQAMEWFVVEPMELFSKNGYDVTLICDMDEKFKSKYSSFAKCIDVKMSRGVSIKDLITVPYILFKIFKNNQFDVLYYQSPNVSLYASWAGFLCGTKYRIYNQCGLRYVSLEGNKRKIFKLVEKITCMFSTHVKSQSYKNMQFSIQEKLAPAKKYSVVGIGGTTGVDLKECNNFDHQYVKKIIREKYTVPNDKFVFGYVGRINADKGINELIQAFCNLHKKYDDIYLMLIGMVDKNNPITEENQRIMKENPNIISAGLVDKNEIYKYMSALDILVHPTYREGFGKVLQEALGVGIPIITTDIPGPSEVIENGKSGLLVEVKNHKDLEEKMELLLNRSDLRELFIKNGLERAKNNFDRPIMLKNILDDMNKMIKKEKK